MQPVWRFRGHSDGRTAFEFYVQAVAEAYIESPSKETALQVVANQEVSLGYSPYPVDPAQLLSEIPQERILIPPEPARALTETVRTPG